MLFSNLDVYSGDNRHGLAVRLHSSFKFPTPSYTAFFITYNNTL